VARAIAWPMAVIALETLSSLDLFSLTVVACTDSSCEACEEADSVSERGVLPQSRIP